MRYTNLPEGEGEIPLDNASLQLLTRFLAGAIVIFAEDLFARMHRWDEQAPDDPLAAGGKPLAEAAKASGEGAVAIVLENDLYRRMGPAAVDAFLASARYPLHPFTS